jgi:hypothetical protein
MTKKGRAKSDFLHVFCLINLCLLSCYVNEILLNIYLISLPSLPADKEEASSSVISEDAPPIQAV